MLFLNGVEVSLQSSDCAKQLRGLPWTPVTLQISFSWQTPHAPVSFQVFCFGEDTYGNQQYSQSQPVTLLTTATLLKG